MGSDRARVTYDPKQQYRSVVMQQGRVTLEADWNEAAQIASEEVRKETLDIVGPCGTPNDGYKVVFTATPPLPRHDFYIKSGTMYVGGLRTYLFDQVQYGNQPDWRDYAGDPDWVDPSSITGSPAPLEEFVYLYLREQEVSAVEDADLKDVALGGPDTAQRTRLLQRFVRLACQGDSCTSGLTVAKSRWQTEGLYFDSSTMRLNSWSQLEVSFANQGQNQDPCQPQAQGGYVDPDNQLIRVQISGIDRVSGNPKFLWGFDDASFLYRINVDPNSPQNLVFQSAPPDASHQPVKNQAVEVLRTAADLPNGGSVAATSGFVVTLDQNYNPDSQSIVLPSGVSLPATYTGSNQSPPEPLFLRVWQQEVVFTPDTAMPLGDTGVLVTLTSQSPNHAFHVGDYWLFAVRPATPQTVYPERYQEAPQSPDGPRLWACPLAVIAWRENEGRLVSDCRPRFGPLANRALHITGTNWPNDDVVSLAEFQNKGVQVAFDAYPDPNSVTSSSVIITLEIPVLAPVSRNVQSRAPGSVGFKAVQARAQQIGVARAGTVAGKSPVLNVLSAESLIRNLRLPQTFVDKIGVVQRKPQASILVFKEELIGFSSLILEGPLSVTGDIASWTVQPPGFEFIRYLSNVSRFGSSPQLRVRITLKGRDVWSQLEGQMLHLDGQVLGQPGTSAFASNPRTNLGFPSGLNAQASDFESWFWLTLIAWNRTDYPVISWISSVATGDFNGDGKPEIAAITLLGAVFILLNQGDGTFQMGANYPTGSEPVSLVTADFTGNGKLDLAICNYSDGTITILLGNGDGTFSPPTNPDGTPAPAQRVGSGPYAIVAADFNGDGKPDLAVANSGDGTVSILLNKGGGTFTTFSPPADVKVGNTPVGLAAADFNKDGFIDLAVVNLTDNNVSFLFNDGKGNFSPSPNTPPVSLPQDQNQFPLSIVGADFNKDTFVDFAVGGVTFDAQGNQNPYVAVFLNNYNNQGAAIFSPYTQNAAVGLPASLATADFEDSGNLDLVASGAWWLGVLYALFGLNPALGGANMFSVLSGNGDGTFQTPVVYSAGNGPVAVAATDFNGDGLVDLAVANLTDGSVSVFLNEQSQLTTL